ncbi:hypothetical protein V2J09_002295 [Rumex salicifolius]
MDALTEKTSRKLSKPKPRLHHQKNGSSTNSAGGQEEEETTGNEIVDLSALSLDEVPQNPNFINPASIYKLDLSNNNLQINELCAFRPIDQSIPESLMARLLNVVVLDVHSNQLTWLPNSIGCLSKLKLLNLSGNLLRAIPKTIENCRSLEELNANFNNLTALPETIGFELINLKKISINSNQIAFLPYSTSHLTMLHVLDARLNRLRSLPEDLQNLVNLKILNVSQNFHYLQKLPSSIGQLPSLIELDVSYNKIEALPPSLGSSEKLEKLCVEGNPLVSPPADVAELGLNAVKEYLNNEARHVKEKKKKGSWFMKRWSTMSRGAARGVRDDGDVVEREARFIRCPRVEAIASPRYHLAMLSPRRMFSNSPKSYNYTKLA